jgi:succinate dehydrogenase / fumarate reductase flavoprotein subunit
MLDLLIIGSGGAGLTAALTAHEAGLSVKVLTKTLPTQAQTCMAQGGINAALGNVTADSIESHIEDTLRAAHRLADPQMVAMMCHEAPQTITWLERMGVPFSRLDHATNPLQSVAQRRLGGASSKRACYAEDYTGLKILHTLYDRCIEAGIPFVTEHYLMNLIVDPDTKRVSGATFWDIQKGEVTAVESVHTLIATGGFGELYHDHTTNSYGSSGDGIAAVLRAGGTVSNMEFVQFHPTALQGSAILISESARGEGGHLIDHHGKRFTDELAPRDVVARAIFRQMQAGHHVRLDIRHLGREKIETLMPQELHLCRLHADIDPIKEPIPIMPVAHYTMGGITTDPTFKVKGLERCYAIGECANAHVHGANRLGGNALLEIVAFGRLVIDTIVAQDTSPSSESIQAQQIEHDSAVIEKIFAKPNEVNFYHKRKVLGRLMYRDAGIIRHRDTMHEAQIYLEEIYAKLEIMGVGDRSRTNNQNLIEFLEFRNAILLAQGVLKSAILRQESRGAHYRDDFSLERSDLEAETSCRLSEGQLVIGIGGGDR